MGDRKTIAKSSRAAAAPPERADGARRSRSLASQPPRLLAAQPRHGQALGGGLDRGQQAEQRQQRAEQPQRQIEGAGRQQQRAAAEDFQDRAGLAALGFGKPRGARDVLRALGDLQRIRAPRVPAFSPTRPTSLASADQRAGLLGAERGLDRADGLARPQHRAGGDRLLQHRRIDDFARRAAGPLRQPFAEPADLAGVLDQREAGAHRRRAADGNVGRRRHREARRGKAEHEAIGLLAHREVLAFAHDVPDVAEHEEIAGDRARQARDIVGVAGHKAGGKTPGEMRGGIFFRDRVVHAPRQFIGERRCSCRARARQSCWRDRHRRRRAPPRYSRSISAWSFRRAESSLRSASSAGSSCAARIAPASRACGHSARTQGDASPPCPPTPN